MMADFSKFRSSLNGFNRLDVANYIEALCAEHRKALASAQEEADALTRQLQEVWQSLEAQNARSAALESELDATRTALDETQAALEQALSDLTEPEAPQEPAAEVPDYTSLELEAYRRAEAMERSSTQRAVRLRTQLDELLEQVSSRCEQTGQEIQVLTDDIRTNLKRLEDTLSDQDEIFDETSASFRAMDAEEFCTEPVPEEELCSEAL